MKKRLLRRWLGVLAAVASFVTMSASPACSQKEREQIGAATAMSEYYVAPNGNDLAEGTKDKPFASLKGAFKAIRHNKAGFDSDITVYMADGEYFVKETDCVVLDKESLPDLSITVKAADNAKPIINGGKKITQWTKTQVNGHTVLKSNVGKGLKGIYSFMANGKAAEIAKSIDEPFDGRNLSPQNSHGKPFAEGSFSWDYYNKKKREEGIVATNNQDILDALVNPSQTQAVWLIEWKEFIICLDKVKGNHLTSNYWEVIAKESVVNSGGEFFWPHPTHRFYLQNDVSLISKPGEFCYNSKSGELYYYPRAGENEDSVVGEIPLATHFINAQGNAETGAIRNVTFHGLTFANSAVDYIDAYGGVAINQAQEFEVAPPTGSFENPEYHRGMMGGAIYLAYCQNVNFTDCAFSNVGLTAIVMDDGVQNCTVQGCTFTDLGNCAVRLSNPANYKATGLAQVRNNTISNNVIRRIGSVNFSAPAILAMYVNGTEICNNDVYDCPYTAISLGWGWRKLDDSYAGENVVAYNKIGNYMMVLKDGGGVYTLGNQPQSVIQGNHFYSQKNNIAGVYLDEATSGYTVTDNAFYLNDLLDENGNVLVADYCKEVPSMFWFNINDATGNGGTELSVMTDLIVLSNHYFMTNGYGKIASHPNNLIPPLLNDDENNPTQRNVGYSSREEFLSSDKVKEIIGRAGLTAEYKHLL